MKPVGYFANGAIEFSRKGEFYNYILAANGVFVTADDQHYVASVRIADCELRGLDKFESYFDLLHGKIPVSLFDLALNAFLADPDFERYLAITWQEDGYHIWQPEQKVSETRIEYQTMENVVLELHSHGRIPACFSAQDNQDEQGFRIYGVVGSLREQPKVRLRLGVYGYFQELNFEDIFAGPCPIRNGDEDD
ncbi:MAG: hypothetical protein JW901_05345 [Dehalococcoidia bacterium]|nr:hypothetical protein [Dehalococcoidia bacterium]